MSNHNIEHHLNIIKQSLSEASEKLKIRDSLSNKIKAIAQAIEEATNSLLVVNDDEPNYVQEDSTHPSSERIINVRHRDHLRQDVIPLFGYRINKTSIFPVLIETETQENFASDEEELYSIITSIITNNSLRIMDLVRESEYDSDIPF